MLGHVGVRAHVELAPVGPVAEGVPGLLARDHEVVPVTLRPAAQRGQVAARLGLGHALAPDLVAPEHGAQEAGLLLGRAHRHDGGGDVGHADGVDRPRRADPGHLLGVGELLEEPGPPAAELRRPRDRSPARVDQLGVPRTVRVEGLGLHAEGLPLDQAAVLGGPVGRQPGSQLGSQRLGPPLVGRTVGVPLAGSAFGHAWVGPVRRTSR